MATIAQHLESMAAFNRVRFRLAERNVEVSKAGGFYKARFAGKKSFAFGVSVRDAKRRLKFFTGPAFGWKGETE